MKHMDLPGFTAESLLFTMHNHYEQSLTLLMAFNRNHALANALATAFLMALCIPPHVSDFVGTNAEDRRCNLGSVHRTILRRNLSEYDKYHLTFRADLRAKGEKRKSADDLAKRLRCGSWNQPRAGFGSPLLVDVGYQDAAVA